MMEILPREMAEALLELLKQDGHVLEEALLQQIPVQIREVME